jgi:glycosyltransferase involved in cell wall biosynthesis
VTTVPSLPFTPFSGHRKLRLAYFATHPIQYQAPMLRRIALEPDIHLKVFFASDLSVRGHLDQEFGVLVKWDTELLGDYEHEFLPVLRDAIDGQVPTFFRPLNRQVHKKLRVGQFDAVWVHGYNYLTNLQALRAARSMKIPGLLRAESTLHHHPRSRMTLAAKKIFFWLLAPYVSAVLSVGDENTAYWKNYLGDQVPIFPCHYAVDNNFFQRESAAAAENREEFRNFLGLETGRPVILFAGKLAPRKRCGDLLEAYRNLVSSGSAQPLPYLLIVGDGEQRADLERRASLAVPGNVRFLGFRNQSEMPRLYDLCNVFVLPSAEESWGMAVNEAMNAGRPVVVTDQVGSHENLVQQGKNGFTYPVGDIAALAGSLRTVLTGDTGREMGCESLRLIQNYSFEQNVLGLREALQALVPGFRASWGNTNNASA